MTYSLMFSHDGTLVDGLDYVSLDEARDVAFDVSLETGSEVSICEEFGASQNVVEVVLA